MPIYFAWFITALLSVGGDANDQNLPQSGRLLYCVRRGFLDIYLDRSVETAGETEISRTRLIVDFASTVSPDGQLQIGRT